LILYSLYRQQLHWHRWVLPAGIVFAATLTLFVAATKLTTAANAIFLQSTAPIYIVILGPLLLRERASRGDLAYLAVLIAGTTICFLGGAGASVTAPDPATGNLVGVASGIAWALTLIALRYLNRDAADERGQRGLAAVIAGNAIACAVALPWALPLPHAEPVEWATVVYLGVAQVALAYICLTNAMRRLPALEISLLLLLEPVLNPLWTWLVRGEQPGGWTIAGGALILGATAIRTAMSAR
jgi:drug/metabolite transporter (DMT)-like permease